MAVILKLTALVQDPGRPVVHEHHPVADEHAVADGHAVADEAVGLHLAVGANASPALDLHESPDPGAIADRAPIEVHERERDNVLAKLDVFDEPVRRVVDRRSRHSAQR